MTQPFLATYYVDPTFVGVSTGSSDSPFVTIAAAIVYAISLGLSGALIKIPPLVVITENIALPDGNWEIACESTSRLATIDGTVDCSPLVSGQYRLTNLTINHAITGTTPVQNTFLILKNSRAQSTVTLSAAGVGFWDFVCTGDTGTNYNALSGFVRGALSVVGTIQAQLYEFLADVTYSVTPAIFDTCRFQDLNMFVNAPASGIGVQMFDCTFVFPFTINGTGGPVKVLMDGPTLTSALSLGLTLTGTATHKTSNGSASISSSIIANVSSTTLALRAPAGLYEAVGDIDLLTPGTGTVQLNVTYTNLSGVLVTVPVTLPFDTSGAGGNEAGAAKQFQHNGASDIKYSTSGVWTGTLGIAVAVRKVS